MKPRPAGDSTTETEHWHGQCLKQTQGPAHGNSPSSGETPNKTKVKSCAKKPAYDKIGHGMTLGRLKQLVSTATAPEGRAEPSAASKRTDEQNSTCLIRVCSGITGGADGTKAGTARLVMMRGGTRDRRRCCRGLRIGVPGQTPRGGEVQIFFNFSGGPVGLLRVFGGGSCGAGGGVEDGHDVELAQADARGVGAGVSGAARSGAGGGGGGGRGNGAGWSIVQ